MLEQTFVDDVILLCDDDYRPLHTIDKTLFIENGCYKAYYFYDLEQWKHWSESDTSYDDCAWKTLAFLKNNGYPTRMYSSHMPQIIDRTVFLEMLNKHPELRMAGCDEWSLYFNYFQAHYPNKIKTEIYRTLTWPGHISDWPQQYIPQQYDFENFYEDLYEQGGLFANCCQELCEQTEQENTKKMQLWKKACAKTQKAQKQQEAACCRFYRMHGYLPSFGILCSPKVVTIYFPPDWKLAAGSILRIPFFFYGEPGTDPQSRVKFRYTIYRYRKRLADTATIMLSPADNAFYVPIVTSKKRGACQLLLEAVVDGVTGKSTVPIILV